MITRRRFTTTALAATACASSIRAFAASSPFHVGVISDEISQDFDHACSVIANDFGLHFVELREIGGKKSAGPPRRRHRPGHQNTR